MKRKGHSPNGYRTVLGLHPLLSIARYGSFSVNAEEGLWFCFGCQKKGDVIDAEYEVKDDNNKE